MKNKRGFTLIELIAVIVILGLVLLIAIPFFSGTLKTFRDDYYNNLNGNMLNAGKEFFNDNRLYLPHKYLDSAIVDANTLNEEQILEELKDYNGNKCEKFESYVIAIRKSTDEVTYDTCIKCLDDNYDNFDEKEACSLAWKEGEGFSEVIFDKPAPVYIYKGTSRSELKKLVITYPDIRRCLGKSGVCEQEIMRVSGKGENGVNPVYPVNLDTVNPNKIGTYNIKYKYESYGNYVDGKVIVYENQAPTVNITKTNKVKTGTITNADVAKTSSYTKSPSNRDDWAQQLNFTFSYNFGEDAKPGLYVTKYQIFFNNRWEDYCTPNKGTNTCNKTETREMDETVKFRMIDSEGHISTFTENMGLRIDRTKPSCQLRTDGTYGLRQWYITDVKISFQSKGDNYGTKPFPNANPIMSGELFSGITLSQIKSNTYDTQRTDTNWITWYGYIEDKANNYQICDISFKRDATAPKCEFTIPNADGDDGWHKMSVVTVSFKTHTDTSGQPDYSGVEDYGFNSWNSGTKVVNHTQDSPAISYHGEIRDMAGNKSTCDISFIKDSTPPTCTAKVPTPDGDEDGGSKWHKMPTVKVEINTIGDNLSGVRDYGLNSWNSGTKVVNHTADTAGITYTYQIRDIAGNMSTCSVWFKKDSTQPQCAITNTGTMGKNSWYTSNVKYSITTHSDNLSGVRDYGYNTNATGDKERTHTTDTAGVSYTAYIRDKAGNTNTCATSFKKDGTKPNCAITQSGTMGDDGWYKGNVTYTISTHTDNLSGVMDYGYETNARGDKSRTQTTDTNTVTRTGYIEDNAGNMNSCTTTYKMDKTAPSCGVTTSGTVGSNGWYKMGSVSGSFTSYTDNLSGVRRYGFDSDSGSHTKSTTSSTSGTTWTGYIRDIAGNTNSCTTWFKFDNSAPSCSGSVNGYDSTSGVSYTVSCTDSGGSGCATGGTYGPWAPAGTSATYSYTMTDNAGNVGKTCKVHVWGQLQGRTNTCSSAKRCSAAGCETWNSCENSACGVYQYKSCANSACGTESCNCSTTNTCSTGVSCAGTANVYSSAGSNYCYTCKVCSTCNKTCRTSACGVESYNKCRTSGCGCETYNASCGTCGCDSYSYGDYGDDSFCSGTSSGGCSYRDCRWVYRGADQG